MIDDLVDARAGEVYTLSNTAQYPADLVNDPGAEHAGRQRSTSCEFVGSCGR
jgi:hypothetical protein